MLANATTSTLTLALTFQVGEQTLLPEVPEEVKEFAITMTKERT